MSADPVSHDSTRTPGYEKRDLALRPVLAAAVLLGAIVVFVFPLIWWIYTAFSEREQTLGRPAHPLAATRARTEPPAPRLQAEPIKDLEALRAWEEDRLGTYAWIDREQGVVRIPIERAMELVAERGLPARDGEGEGGP